MGRCSLINWKLFFLDIFSFFAHTLTHVFFWYYSHIQKKLSSQRDSPNTFAWKTYDEAVVAAAATRWQPVAAAAPSSNFRYIITHGRNDHHHDAGGMNIEHHHFDEGLRCQTQSPCLSLF